MSAHQAVALSIEAFALLFGIGFGIGGWLLPLNDDANRFTFRYLACGAFAAAMTLRVVTPGTALGWIVMSAFAAVWLYFRTGYWWHESERARKLRKVQARR